MYRLMGFITGLCIDDIMETINHLLQMQRGIGFGVVIISFALMKWGICRPHLRQR